MKAPSAIRVAILEALLTLLRSCNHFSLLHPRIPDLILVATDTGIAYSPINLDMDPGILSGLSAAKDMSSSIDLLNFF